MSPSTPSDHDPGGEAQLKRSSVRLFARNRRDGARLLSSTLIIAVIGLVAWDHPVGRSIAVVAGALSLFWWLQYRQLRS